MTFTVENVLWEYRASENVVEKESIGFYKVKYFFYSICMYILVVVEHCGRMLTLRDFLCLFVVCLGREQIVKFLWVVLVSCKKVCSIHILGVTLYAIDHNHAKDFSCFVIVMDNERVMGAG